MKYLLLTLAVIASFLFGHWLGFEEGVKHVWELQKSFETVEFTQEWDCMPDGDVTICRKVEEGRK